MVSVRTKLFSAAAAAALSTAAFAADMPMPPPVYQTPIVVEQPTGAWYLRGDVGVGMESSSIDYLENPAHSTGFVFDQHSMSDTTFFDVGVGYELNNWLRFDVTAGYRDRAQVNARGVYNPVTGQGDAYQGYLKSWLFLANAYLDLGTWDCLTPFVGVGVGGAYNTMADLVDQGIGTTGAGFGRNSSNFGFAYALYAGLDYAVTKNFSVELSYRYLNYGSVTDTIDCVGGCIPDSYKWSNLASNDFMLGMRWRFPVEGGFAVEQPAAYVAQPAPVYTPPPPPPAPPPAPIYSPPQYPLSTRG